MHCRKCGEENMGASETCISCGADLPLSCARCGSVIVSGARFCVGCGAELSAAGLADASGQKRPGTQIGPLIDSASHILNEQSGPTRELKNVTVLFADVTNSTGLIEGLSPEASTRLLKPIVKMMTAAVHHHGGVVSQLQGDGLMALFGAPLALEDHALRACRAALAIQQSSFETLRIHIGLSTGLALVRSLDTDLFMDHDPAGWTVHLAARMVEMAAPGEIHMTASTAEQVEGFVTLERLGPTRIRGVQSQVQTYRLTGLSGKRTRWDARRALGLNRFVGRSEELALLRQVMHEAQAGQGKAVAIRGEAGIGKSRMLFELQETLDSGSWQVLSAASQPDSTQIAYLAIRQLLMAWLDGAGRAEDPIGPRLEAALTALFPDALTRDGILPVFRSLLDLEAEDETWQQLDAFERRQAIQVALQSWLRSMSEVAPTALIFEDLHWIDPESEAILYLLVTTARDLPAVVLLSCRESYDWQGPWLDREVLLTGLPKPDAEQLLSEMLGDDRSLQRFKQMLVDRAGGTPLFLEELVRSLAETGRMAGQPGDYRPAADTGESDVPGSIAAIVSARIDFQSPEAKNMLELAAVAGSGAWPLLVAATSQDKTSAMSGLHQLLDAGLLRMAGSGDQLRFHHDIVREITYSLILEERRCDLHRRVAMAIEAYGHDNLDDHVDQLARHYLAGEVWDQAARYHFKACLRALARSSNRQVVTFARAGITALSHIPLTEELRNLAVDLRLVANNALITIGDIDGMVDNLRDVEALVEEMQDSRRAASVKAHLAIALWLHGDHDRAQEVAFQALSIARDIGHPELQMGASTALAMTFHAIGRFGDAVGLFEKLRARLTGPARLVRAGWTAYPFVLIDTFLASAYLEQGDFCQARERIDEAREFADERAHPYSQATILDYDGYHLLVTGQVEAAVPVFERGLEICNQFDLLNLHRSISAKLARAEIRLGRIDAALSRLTEAIDMRDFLRGGTYIWHWLFLAHAEALLAAADPEAALKQIQHGLDLTGTNGERPHLGQALKLKGDVLTSLGPARWAEAEACYRGALAEAEACQMRPLLAQTGQALGEVLAKIGLHDDAQDRFRQALQIFDTLGPSKVRDSAHERLSTLIV